jgi:drug/metabolite transporter (DMT)-like permease
MRFTAWIVLVATQLLWAGNWVVARAVRADVTPGIATVGRLLIVLAILLPFAFSGLRDKFPSLKRRDWLVLAALGVAGGGPHFAMQWLGLHFTTATSGILYMSMTPIFILLMALPLGERIGALQWIGVAISFCGVALIVTQGDLGLLSFNIGDLLALGSMVMWAWYTVLLRMRRDPLSTVELLVMVCGFGLASMVPWLALELCLPAPMKLGGGGALAVAYSAIGSLLLAYAGWSYVVRRLGAARAGVTMHLMPAFGVGLSAIFLREYPTWFHFAGIALVLAGVALSSGRINMRGLSPQERVP